MRKSLYIFASIVALLLTACASVGRPEGGPRDELPPEFVRSNPAQGERGVTRRTFTVVFDENVALEDAFTKVVVSPVQLEAPQISSNGRRVTVELRDTLIPDATYTVDFGDAIKDLNEGNVLDGFALEFSTGEHIDTLRISGRVMQASNLEPAQGIIVAAFSNTADSAIRTLPPDRIARTNQYGQFTIRNLADKDYRVYALNDLNRDYHWDRSEDVAFLDTLIHPQIEAVWVTDTLYDTHGADSTSIREGRRYLPNDVLLTWFNEDYKAQYLKDYGRPDRRRVLVQLAAPVDSLPEIRAVSGNRDGENFDSWALPVYNQTRDSLMLWLTDTAMVANDSLRLSVRYQKPDSLDRLVWQTDTLRFFFREQKAKKSKKEQEADTLGPKLDLLELQLTSGSNQDVYLPMRLELSQPAASIDSAGVRLEMQVDTVWEPVKDARLTPAPDNPVLAREIWVDWEPGGKYRLTVDSAAIHSIYGEHNPPLNSNITVTALEDYGSLTFILAGADSTAVVELLNTSDVPQRRERAIDGRATFKYLQPGNYYARMFFDTDGNGLWSTGVLDSIQPEEVAYYPKKIELKRNWDIEQNWDIYELPVDRQKPYAILKNRPKLRRGEKAPETEEQVDEDPMLGGNNSLNNRRNNNRRNNSLGGNRAGGGRQMMNVGETFRR
ncbi:MAG: Ig-like domain-containing protein [Bacteroidales bacterium]|nr:Ig-like domain-containing protein [Bacteroidales bacterium]